MSLKVFITGATGFVGCYLIELLDSPEYTIYGTSFPERPEAENIFFMDVRSEEEIFRVIKEKKPDWVFHLAAVSNVKHSWEKRRETLEINIVGTFNLFEAIRKFAPLARVLFVSSSDVYGVSSAAGGALCEEEPTQAVNPYAYTKLCGEILSRFYAQIENMDIVIARSFPHTGPGQSPDFVCSDWASQIARIEKGLAEPVIKVGNISVQRDFLDVRDVVKAYALLMEKGKTGEVYNVCSGKSVLLKEILNILLSFSSKAIEIQVDSQKLRKSDISLLFGDNRKIKQELSWEPEIPLKQSLFDLLEYWRGKVKSEE